MYQTWGSSTKIILARKDYKDGEVFSPPLANKIQINGHNFSQDGPIQNLQMFRLLCYLALIWGFAGLWDKDWWYHGKTPGIPAVNWNTIVRTKDIVPNKIENQNVQQKLSLWSNIEIINCVTSITDLCTYITYMCPLASSLDTNRLLTNTYYYLQQLECG